MRFTEVHTHLRNYATIGVLLLGTWLASSMFGRQLDGILLAAGNEGTTLLTLSSLVVIFSLGFLIYELAKPTFIPSFVLAIFFGIVARDALLHLTQSAIVLHTVITIGAALILFGGGLDTPFQKFRELMGPISSLSLVGALLTAFLFSLVIQPLASLFGVEIPLSVAVLLGAILCSTDPAAIIPSFQSMLFTRPRVKHIAISESALTDVIGVVLVAIFFQTLASGEPTSVLGAYAALVQPEQLVFIGTLLLVGTAVGVAGYGILLFWSRYKSKVQTDEGCDAALFLAVPLFSYTLSTVLGGSGFLATFLSGLLFSVRTHCRHVEHYFNHTIESFMKPMIFILLGALVDPVFMWQYAGLGVVACLVFVFVIRPLVVFVTLAPFSFGQHAFTIRELTFLSFVRETGVIPAVLLIAMYLSGSMAGAQEMMAIGMWVILLTLLIEPPLTPWIACRLGIAKDGVSTPKRKHSGPVVVLCSRGYSFPERMKTVVDWALQHSVENVVLLHCPEDRYSPAFVSDVRKRANQLFASINRQFANEGKRELNFEFLCGPGQLQTNIELLISSGDVSIIFVGSKMLDFRLNDVKHLKVPFYFMD